MDKQPNIEKLAISRIHKPALSKEERINYYKNNKPILLPDSNFRHFRLILEDGTVLPIRHKITSPEKLQRILVSTAPVGVYCTVSRWLAPERFRGIHWKKNATEGGYKHLSRCFLWADYVVDIDNKDEKNYKKILTKLKDLFPQEDITSIETGNGYHIHIHDYYIPPSKKPLKRYEEDETRRKKLTTLLQKHGLQFDFNISNDPCRLIRVPNTLHSNGDIINIIYKR